MSSKCKTSESPLCPLQLTAFSYLLEVMPSTLIHLTYSCDMGIHSKEEIVLWSVAVFLQASQRQPMHHVLGMACI